MFINLFALNKTYTIHTMHNIFINFIYKLCISIHIFSHLRLHFFLSNDHQNKQISFINHNFLCLHSCFQAVKRKSIIEADPKSIPNSLVKIRFIFSYQLSSSGLPHPTASCFFSKACYLLSAPIPHSPQLVGELPNDQRCFHHFLDIFFVVAGMLVMIIV